MPFVTEPSKLRATQHECANASVFPLFNHYNSKGEFCSKFGVSGTGFSQCGFDFTWTKIHRLEVYATQPASGEPICG